MRAVRPRRLDANLFRGLPALGLLLIGVWLGGCSLRQEEGPVVASVGDAWHSAIPLSDHVRK